MKIPQNVGLEEQRLALLAYGNLGGKVGGRKFTEIFYCKLPKTLIYNFAFFGLSNRKNNDDLIEDIRGRAEKKGNAIIVTYQKPEKKTLKLPEGVLFPTQHVKTLLSAAQGEEQIFPHVVFDGSSAEGASEINAFVGAQKIVEADPTNKAAHQFANQPFWPVRFAVYGPEATDYDPIYVTTQDLLPNGIIKQYVIDYGGVKIHGVLERLELLRDGGC